MVFQFLTGTASVAKAALGGSLGTFSPVIVCNHSLVTPRKGFSGPSLKGHWTVRVSPVDYTTTEHNVGRSSSDNSYICLENNGMVNFQAVFDVNLRKEVALKTKQHQFSASYKVEGFGFRNVLNKHYDHGFIDSATGEVTAEIKNVKQVFTGSINGEKFTTTLDASALGDSFTHQPEVYMKAVVYSIFSEYRAKVLREKTADAALTSQLQNSSMELLRLGYEVLYSEAKGLYVLQSTNPIFGGSNTNSTTIPAQPQLSTDNSDGRDLIEEIVAASVTTPVATPDTVFTPFAKLPFATTVYDIHPGHVEVVTARKTGPTDPLFFLKDLKQLSSILARGPIVQYSLVIEARTTTYEIQPSSWYSPGLNKAPLIYGFHENMEVWERLWVLPSYLAAAFQENLIRYVQQVHSKQVSYRSFIFEGIGKVEWSPDGSYCRNQKFNMYSRKELYLKIGMTGANPTNAVNNTSNLLFVSDFAQKHNSPYRTVRLISCSCLTSNAQISLPENQTIFTDLEQALALPIILSEVPTVTLYPVCSRGNLIQKVDGFLFRGLSNSASSNSSFNTPS
jgi:hypothetical protein